MTINLSCREVFFITPFLPGSSFTSPIFGILCNSNNGNFKTALVLRVKRTRIVTLKFLSNDQNYYQATERMLAVL